MSNQRLGSLLDQISLGKSRDSASGSKSGFEGLDSSEERIASRFGAIRGLKPPVDVFSVAASLAHFSQEDFPVDDIDGLSLDLKLPGKKPTILVNKRRGYHRKRFTVAHEIGHIVIPWHTGSIIDDLDAELSGSRDEYRQLEAQANRFATELLMPRAWAEDICTRAEHLRDGMHAIQSIAQVSFHAAALRAAQAGPVGYLIASIQDGVVSWAGKTRGTRARPPRQGTPVDAVQMPAFDLPQVLHSPIAQYYFWKELPGVSPEHRPTEAWRDILERMLTNIPIEHRFKTRQRINAIVGNAFGRAPPEATKEILYQRVLEVFQNRSDRDAALAAVLKHPEVTDYILARIFERESG